MAYARGQTRARAGILSLLLLAAARPQPANACDSTGCLFATRSAGGLLPRRGWRVDLSYRSSDDSVLMRGSDGALVVNRPKVDFENRLVRPGFHQDLGGTARFLQVDLAYGVTGNTMLLASAPIVRSGSYDWPPATLTENYQTSGLGDTLVGARHAFVATPGFSLVGGLGVELPTGAYRLASPAALFDIGVLDPMLQPGSGSFDLVLSAQAAQRLTRGGLDLAAAVSYQYNTTNDLDYRYGSDLVASLSLGGPIGTRVRASAQVKWAHRDRSAYRDQPVPSTGGDVLYAIPGVIAALPGRVSIYLFLPVPLYRYVNETQLAPRLSLVLGIARSF